METCTILSRVQPLLRTRVKESEKSYWSCWVCSRQHHSYCVGQERFICAACQKRTLDKSIGAVQRFSQQLSNSSISGMGNGMRTRESSRRIVEIPSVDSTFTGMNSGSIFTQHQPSMQTGNIP